MKAALHFTHLALVGLSLFTARLVAAPTSDPVGALRLKLRGNSDTIVSLPLHRPTLVEGKLAERDGNELTLDADVPSLPAEGAYALVISGALEGAVLPITSKSSDTLTLDNAGYDLDSVEPGNYIAVIPYWTLDTVFPNGLGAHITTSILSPKTRVLFFPEDYVGINDSSSASYFYFAGNSSKSAGWYRTGDLAAPRGSTRITPHTHIIVRHPNAADTDLLLAGAVQMSKFRIPLTTREPNSAQDNRVALPFALPTTLAASALVSSGAFTATSNVLSPQDQLIVFDNTVVGQNKSATASYFYLSGNGSPTDGWYRTGDSSQSADQVALLPGDGFTIRKQATATPDAHDWTFLPSYLQ